MTFIDNIIQYIMEGTITRGSFKWHLLTGNLFEAVRQADPDNFKLIPELVTWLFTYGPSDSYGSEASVTSWIEAGGMIGIHGEAHTLAWKSTIKDTL